MPMDRINVFILDIEYNEKKYHQNDMNIFKKIFK